MKPVMPTTTISLRTPISGGYEGQGFDRRYIWTYRCPQGHIVHVRCSSWRGKNPEPGIGAITCPQCEFALMGGGGH